MSREPLRHIGFHHRHLLLAGPTTSVDTLALQGVTPRSRQVGSAPVNRHLQEDRLTDEARHNIAHHLERDGNVSIDQSFDDLLEANRAFADDFRLSGFDGIARAGVGMLTCMDSRIDPLGMIGLAPGDAKIIRNPGARLTPVALEAMVLGVNLLQVRRILLVPHTRCAAASNTAQEISELVAASAGVADAGMEFHVVEDQVAALTDDVRTLAEHPLIAGQAQVAGFIYDVDTGLLERRA